ncbi:MAG: sigma factor-like helix-turn-helix DNA-binding protein [Christensenellales bacterium]
MAQRGGELTRKVSYGLLTSYYGALLTDRQQAMLRLYCDEDLSVGEVAQQFDVTRQCVSDTLLRACERLDQLEASLGLVARFKTLRSSVTRCRELIVKAAETGDSGAYLSRALQVLDDYLREEEA